MSLHRTVNTWTHGGKIWTHLQFANANRQPNLSLTNDGNVKQSRTPNSCECHKRIQCGKTVDRNGENKKSNNNNNTKKKNSSSAKSSPNACGEEEKKTYARDKQTMRANRFSKQKKPPEKHSNEEKTNQREKWANGAFGNENPMGSLSVIHTGSGLICIWQHYTNCNCEPSSTHSLWLVCAAARASIRVHIQTKIQWKYDKLDFKAIIRNGKMENNGNPQSQWSIKNGN